VDVKFDVGNWQVSRVEEWSGGFTTPEQLFPEYDAAYFATVRDALRPDHLTHDGIIEAVFQVWVARRNGLTVLIDTGAGNDKERPGLPSVGGMTTPFLARLDEAGVAREDVDLVVCTHLHVDHVGWNTMLIDGRWVPTFPSARYVFPAIDRDVWDPAGPHFATMRGAGVAQGVFEDSVQPILDAGIATLAADGEEIAPGMRMHHAPGHTPGHMIVDIADGGERALFTGDVIHHPVQVLRPDWNSCFCEDAALAIATRRRVLADAADTRARVVPAHFGGAHSTFVERAGDGFACMMPSVDRAPS
jgi:glyoxylase-like metal-dependent hydrolase (beta-lactamase superfamily II)